MRGKTDGSIEFAIAELFGGIKLQIIFRAAETGLSAEWIASRLAALLSPQGQRVQHSLPTMQSETTGTHRALESLEMAEYAHSGKAPVAITAGANGSEIPKGSVKGQLIKSAQAAYWERMTPAQRSAEMARRLSKRGNLTPSQIKAIRTLKKTAAGRPPKAKPGIKIGANGHKYVVETTEQRQVRLQRYHQRHQAKKRGDVVPPLIAKSVVN